MKHRLIAAAAAVAVLASCQKQADVAPQEKQGGVSYRLRATQEGGSLQGRGTESAATVTWTSGFANAKELKFHAVSGSGNIEYRSTIATKIDLFDSTGFLGNISVPAGNYKEVKFRIGVAPSGTEPGIELRGSYNGTPVIFWLSKPFFLETKAKNVTIDSTSSYTALNNLSLPMLTDNISNSLFDGAFKTDGTIIISADSNRSIYEKMLANIMAATKIKFFKGHRNGDDDEDDDDEDDD